MVFTLGWFHALMIQGARCGEALSLVQQKGTQGAGTDAPGALCSAKLAYLADRAVFMKDMEAAHGVFAYV